jgi:ABC-type antimicrobial peptide transport system permease subunit
MATGTTDELDIQIVGLVRDAKYSEVKDEVPPLFFRPYRQNENIGAINFYVRSALPPEQTMRSVRTVVAGLDPSLPIENLKTLPQQVRENVALDRTIGTLSAGFAAVATLLAAVGLYGVLAYTVTLRRREIGVRMALGADSPRVRRLVLRQVIGMLLIGGPVGIAAALGLGRVAGSLLYGMAGNDPVVVTLAAGALGLIALGTGYIPALRASRVDPMQALRYE